MSLSTTKKFKYHSKGLGKNKAIKEERKKPLPLGLMKMPHHIEETMGIKVYVPGVGECSYTGD